MGSRWMRRRGRSRAGAEGASGGERGAADSTLGRLRRGRLRFRRAQPSTTIDALEKEFQRKKQRELAAASRAGRRRASQPTQRRTGEKVGRNDPCPCGSGKKYKKCHGATAG